ncbi:MAG: plasmid maintenance protein CcdB [Candidatus Tectomicrobia bacterium]|uniref:Toxin CcdB n=1 Tax=Tectimicrobiota bacterium TaxID=2528274 RepID=A0A937VY81_UNCTE|nr:plasmid maintenance protein CcdB [Candidatus Tectomicrobia bacterium]
MAQWDVYVNPHPDTSHAVPYLLDVQSDLLAPLVTRVVVPLVRYGSMPSPARHLNPVFEVQGERVVMSTAELAGVPLQALGAQVTGLVEQRDVIMRALDFLFSGV